MHSLYQILWGEQASIQLVPELRRIYDLVKDHSEQIKREYGPEGLKLFNRVKY